MTKKPARRRTRSAPKGAATSFVPPLTVSHPAMLTAGRDEAFRETVYGMVQAFGRLQTCRDAFGRAMGLTGSQFAVLMGTAHRQYPNGVSIRTLADWIHLAPTHVTTEVGRLIRKGLLLKRVNKLDRRSVLVRLSPRAEVALTQLAPFVLRVNDLLFQGISKEDFITVSKFLHVFILNTENALGEIRRVQRQRSTLKP